MKKNSATPCLVLLSLLCLCGMAHADTLGIVRPWVREAPPSSRVLAAYMSISNPGDAAVSISGISSPDFERAELHRSIVTEGMARMQPVEHIGVPANGSIRLEPGGLHLMLFKPRRALAAGDRTTLTLHLSNGICLTFTVPVIRQAGDGLHR